MSTIGSYELEAHGGGRRRGGGTVSSGNLRVRKKETMKEIGYPNSALLPRKEKRQEEGLRVEPRWLNACIS